MLLSPPPFLTLRFISCFFPGTSSKKKILLSIVYGLLISVGAAVIGYFLIRYFIESGYLIDMDEGGKKGRSTALTVIAVMTFIGLLCGIVALVIKGFITWFNEIKVKEELKEKSHQMEMALVKSQFDPHLLFNTINNIDSLILMDAVKASEYLNKLSDIIRFVLYETKGDAIPLSSEIEYITKYIALQKIRTANENYVQFSVNGTISNKRVVPMVFIPFIENAFKHSTNKKLENAITINLHIKEDSVQLLCENKYDSKQPVQQTSGGLGNQLIEKRLDLIYSERHKLEINNSDELYSVNLTIPYD